VAAGSPVFNVTQPPVDTVLGHCVLEGRVRGGALSRRSGAECLRSRARCRAGHDEFACVSEDGFLARKPANL